MASVEMLARQVIHQLVLTDNDLRPGRLLDHELLSRFLSYTLWFLIAMALGTVIAYRFWISKMVRLLSTRMMILVTITDWYWIIGAGIFCRSVS